MKITPWTNCRSEEWACAVVGHLERRRKPATPRRLPAASIHHPFADDQIATRLIEGNFNDISVRSFTLVGAPPLIFRVDLSEEFRLSPKSSGLTWEFLFSSCSARRCIAALARRFWSASRVYRSTSASVLWPVMEAISFAEHPASANLRAAALRRPCGTQCSGSFAFSIRLTVQLPKPATLKGFPYSVRANAF